ncbi:MAG TPA: GspMb/PilO family protein [Pyrinomonadaceae bacterium]|jgi:Tfp pilus assembly protein PilO
MSEQTPTSPRVLPRDRIRARLQTFNAARGQRVLGPAEIIALAGSAVILLLVIASYIYFLVPARLRLDALTAERSRLQAQLRTSQDIVRQGQTTEERVQAITQSLDVFENKLVGANSGRMGLYDSLNSLIRKNGLRNTSGPAYTPLEPLGSKTSAGSKSANTKWQSIYPGIAINVTVEGQYQNLRRFVQDIETSRQFIIINSVELERSTETNASPVVEGEAGAATAAPRPALVSLRLGMSTYFQRSSPEETAVGEGVN